MRALIALPLLCTIACGFDSSGLGASGPDDDWPESTFTTAASEGETGPSESECRVPVPPTECWDPAPYYGEVGVGESIRLDRTDVAFEWTPVDEHRIIWRMHNDSLSTGVVGGGENQDPACGFGDLAVVRGPATLHEITDVDSLDFETHRTEYLLDFGDSSCNSGIVVLKYTGVEHLALEILRVQNPTTADPRLIFRYWPTQDGVRSFENAPLD